MKPGTHKGLRGPPLVHMNLVNQPQVEASSTTIVSLHYFDEVGFFFKHQCNIESNSKSKIKCYSFKISLYLQIFNYVGPREKGHPSVKATLVREFRPA